MKISTHLEKKIQERRKQLLKMKCLKKYPVKKIYEHFEQRNCINKRVGKAWHCSQREAKTPYTGI